MSAKVRVLVPISGGKDSQACLQLAAENHPRAEIRGLFCDTQFEHPLTYEHVEKMRDLYGVRIDRVCEGDVLSKSVHYGRFPGGGARFCTDELKIRPTKKYCKALAEEQGSFIARNTDSIARKVDAKLGGFEVWYGMRSGESDARAKRYAGKVCDEVYPPHEVMPSKYPQYLAKLGVSFRLAVLNWSKLDVLEYLDGQENPLYETFDRVGCFPCQAAGDPHKEKAYAYDDFGREQKRKVFAIAQQINKPMFNSKGGQARNPGCGVCSI